MIIYYEQWLKYIQEWDYKKRTGYVEGYRNNVVWNEVRGSLGEELIEQYIDDSGINDKRRYRLRAKRNYSIYDHKIPELYRADELEMIERAMNNANKIMVGLMIAIPILVIIVPTIKDMIM